MIIISIGSFGSRFIHTHLETMALKELQLKFHLLDITRHFFILQNGSLFN
jgi:hypothetical protein